MGELASVIKVSVLLTGDELLTGDIVDSNSAYLSKELSLLGLTPFERVTVSDDKASIAGALRRLTAISDIVIINGGLGSTVDDLTAEVVADVAGVPLEENATATAHIIEKFGKEYLEQHLHYSQQVKKQALIPQNATTIPNPVGIALGFKIKIARAVCYVTPGVPKEMKHMVDSTILPDIEISFNLPAPIRQSRIFVTAVGESLIQHQIKQALDNAVWDRIHLGFRAGSHAVEVKLSIDDKKNEPLLEMVENQIRELFGGNIFQFGGTLAEEVVGILSQNNQWLAVAESCTGGKIAADITGVSGASSVFDRGIVSYSNKAKQSELNVSNSSLENYGAVSREVVMEMVNGIISSANSDVGVAVTGIAGPTGGSEQKPVGTVYIGWGNDKTVQTRKFLIKRDRTQFQSLVAATALDLLRRFMLGLKTDSPYYYDDLSRHQLKKRV